jgi:hypothetical protein
MYVIFGEFRYFWQNFVFVHLFNGRYTVQVVRNIYVIKRLLPTSTGTFPEKLAVLKKGSIIFQEN